MNTIERTQWPATESIFYPQERGMSAYFNATGFDTFGCYDKCKKTHPVDLVNRSKCRKRCDTEADQFFELEKIKVTTAPEMGFNQAVASLSAGTAGPEMRMDEAEGDNTALIVGVFIFLLLLGGAGYWYYTKSKSTVVAPIVQK